MPLLRVPPAICGVAGGKSPGRTCDAKGSPTREKPSQPSGEATKNDFDD